ncbi:MAG: autotransporter-associated beta strand repeat-containing protein [Kiritimatiellae bacterium]|nr:autotransporter-associated beta strand repeat-containing protein [Kiritimatiellia bacterium]
MNNRGTCRCWTVFFSLSVSLLPAGEYLWTGAAANGLWSDAANWTPAGVPAETNDLATFAASALVASPAAYTGGVSVTAGTLTLVTPVGASHILAGPVSGAGALAVEGPGTLALFGVNTAFTGPVAVTNGTLLINDEAALGDAVAPLTIHPSGVLDLGGATNSSSIKIVKPVTVAGTVDNSSLYGQHHAFGGCVTLAAGARFTGSERFDIRDGILDLDGQVFTKTGANSVQIVGTTAVTNEPSGTAFSVQAGELLFADSVTFSGTSASTVEVAAAARLAVYLVEHPIPYSVRAAADVALDIHDTSSVQNTNLNIYAGPLQLDGDIRATGFAHSLQSLRGPVSGTGGLTAASGELLLAHPDNDYSGPTVVSNGVLRPLTPAALSPASALIVKNGGTLRLLSAPTSAEGWTDMDIAGVLTSSVFLDPTARLGIDTSLRDVTLNAPLADFTHGLVKYGTGTLDYLVSGSLESGALIVREGTLNIGPESALTLPAPAAVTVDSAFGQTGYLNIAGSASLATADLGQGTNQPALYVGSAGRGVVTLTNTASASVGRLDVGRENGSAGIIRLAAGTLLHSRSGTGNTGLVGVYNGSYGYIQNDGGTVTNNGDAVFGLAAGSCGIYRQTAGAFAMAGGTVAPAGTQGGYYGGLTYIGRSGTGHAYVSGGSFVQYGNNQIHMGSRDTVNGGLAVLTVDGDASVSADRIDCCANNPDSRALINLLGGTLSLRYIWRSAQAGNAAAVNFNGGTFRVPNNPMTLFQGGASCLIYPGGGTIDTAGQNATPGTSLACAPGMGVDAIALGTPGSGYLAPPLVTLSGGGGTGAVAFAEIDPAAGAVTAIRILNPGAGYSSRPSVALTGGGGSGASATVTRIAPQTGGGFTKAGAGTLTLSHPSSYTGPTAVRGGTLSIAADGALPASPVTVGGGGIPATLSLNNRTVTVPSLALDEGGLVIGGIVATPSIIKDSPGVTDLEVLCAAPSALTPGLYAAQIVDTGLTWTAVQQLPLPHAAAELGATLANTPASRWAPNHAGLYAGFIWNRSPTNETWSFAESIDDNALLVLDGEVLFNDARWGSTTVATRTVTPGPHAIELRVYNHGGVGGPAAQDGWTTSDWGFGVDRLGRGLKDTACYERLLDPGDGSLLTVNTNAAAIRAEVRQGTLRLTTGARPGLYAAQFTNVEWSTTSPVNPRNAVELGATLANSPKSQWTAKHLGIYTGVIWNRSPTNETWNFAESIDDNAWLSLDGTAVINNGSWNTTTVSTNIITPGPHAIELRVYNNTGGAGPVAQDGWTATDWGFGVDRLGRGLKDTACYEPLIDPGDGSFLTTGSVEGDPFQDVPVDVAPGAALDLNSLAQRVQLITGGGTVTNGALASGSALSPGGDDAVGTLTLSGVALGAAVYRVTLRDAGADILAFTQPTDLSALTLLPSDAFSLVAGGRDYIIATAPSFTGNRPALSGFPSHWKVIIRGGDLHLTAIGGTLFSIQ